MARKNNHVYLFPEHDVCVGTFCNEGKVLNLDPGVIGYQEQEMISRHGFSILLLAVLKVFLAFFNSTLSRSSTLGQVHT